MKRKWIAAIGAAVLVLAACDGGGGATPVQVTQAQLAAQNNQYNKRGKARFTVPGAGVKGDLGIAVNSRSVRSKNGVAQKLYYAVRIDRWGNLDGTVSAYRFPDGYLDVIPNDLLMQAHGAIVDGVASRRLMDVAMTVSRISICAEGRPMATDEARSRIALTPEQSARVAATFGGNATLLLTRTPQQLQQLGLGDINTSKRERVPTIEFVPGLQGYVDVHMVCVF